MDARLMAIIKRSAGAIFDLDGVIVRTDGLHRLAWRRLCDEERWYFDEGIADRLRGVSRMASLSIILASNGITPPADRRLALAERKNAFYRASLQTLSPADVAPGVANLLQSMRRLLMKTAIASGSRNATFVLERLKLLSWFDAVVTGDAIESPKPDPEAFLLAARRLGVEPECCVVFEDAPAGIEAAHRAGMVAVGIGDAALLGAAELVLSGL